MNHLLIDKAFKFPSDRDLEDPENCVYDELRGWWVWKGKEVLVKSNNPLKPVCGTKKNDIETGEDSKGE